MEKFIRCDAHNHLRQFTEIDKQVDGFRNLMRFHNHTKAVIHALPYHGNAENFEALYCKDKLAPSFFTSMGITYRYDDRDSAESFLEELVSFRKMGVDGIKCFEGKPEFRKQIKRPLDDKIYDKFYAYAEENNIPVTFHLGDPSEFWDEERAPEWAKKKGDVYYKGGYEPLEKLRQETFGILDKFPKLNLTYAHFFFLSDNLERAEEIFEKYPNVRFDLTPGVEMYANFSADYDKSVAFIKKYASRLVYGTDMDSDYNGGNRCWATVSPAIVQKCLEPGEVFDEDAFSANPLKPLCLDDETLDTIYRKNFTTLYGETPRALDYELISFHANKHMSENLPFEDIEKENMKIVCEYFDKKAKEL